MMKLIVILFMIVCCLQTLQAQKKHKNVLQPGLSIAYLPTWILDDNDGNTTAKVMITSLNGHQEIWKESVLIYGLGYGKDNEKEYDHKGIIASLKLQKFFKPDRKGFNLSIGLLMNYCKTCQERIDGTFSHEISYMFSGYPFQINAGLQFLEGALFDEPAVSIGGQVQLIYHPGNSLNRD